MNQSKENMGNAPSSKPIKVEPAEARIALSATKSNFKAKDEPSDSHILLHSVKREPTSPVKIKTDLNQDSEMPEAPSLEAETQHDDATHPKPVITPPGGSRSAPITNTDYTVYKTGEFEYDPEVVLKQGIKMVNALDAKLEAMELGSRRKDVWRKNVESLRSQGVPTTLIAICTGAGKSSILNAILDNNIVPTSGMRGDSKPPPECLALMVLPACTAVVTEIAYHKKKTIDADVSFLAELSLISSWTIWSMRWNTEKNNDLASDAGIAWSKVQAFQPVSIPVSHCWGGPRCLSHFNIERLIKMTPDEIIAKDPKIQRVLGATKTISAPNSKEFSIEIAKYVDSKDQRRGKDKDKKDKKKDPNAPAFWPLIKQVNVRCSAAALSTGAVLVDLPGTGDANAARSRPTAPITGKKTEASTRLYCESLHEEEQLHLDTLSHPPCRGLEDSQGSSRGCIPNPVMSAFELSILSSIQTNVSCPVDGGYDDHTITFIATKCDDISCSEIINNLQLDGDPELEEIEERLERAAGGSSKWKKAKTAAEKECKTVDKEVKRLRAIKSEWQARLEAFKDGVHFEPKLTATKTPATKKENSNKRKNRRSGKKGSPKRRKGSDDDESDFSDDIESDDDSSLDSDSEKEDSDKDSDAGSGSDDGSDTDSDKDGSDSDHEDENENEITEEFLREMIKEANDTITSTRQKLSEARSAKKEASEQLDAAKKVAKDAQKEKNAFCARKRSEFSCDVLKEDFRTGLKELDDAAAEERNPDTFDPTQNLRDYGAVDLPVFTCSSRDYVRITRQVKGDGEPACFTNKEDTGIPAVQAWCHTLTRSGRDRAAKSYITQLSQFARDIQHYVEGITTVTASDRDSLREQWESVQQPDDQAMYDDDPFSALLGGGSLYRMHARPKVDHHGKAVGVAPRLQAEFSQVIEATVTQLHEHFKTGLEEKCRLGAINAAEKAVITSDEFAASMHWASYRATLRRHGEYRRDLNAELLNPFTRNIAQTWQQVFEADVFETLLTSINARINALVNEVEISAAAGLKERARIQGDSCIQSARVALDQTVSSSSYPGRAQRWIRPCNGGTGTGSVKRQKASFHTFVAENKHEIFEDGADVIMDRLAAAAEAVGTALQDAMINLAEKVENDLAVLWEHVHVDPKQITARAQIVIEITSVLHQLSLFSAAEAAHHGDFSKA
ncbi:unnamed protein product [Mycena citricolor]|uniref:Nuclear GTPase SLIP-GC n=1 Tax=Mycena citricolor TaxID=2018698 RepID=A0AAD2HIE6_9AGAR|nr:unnamed protein product [Mycena citricolor]